MSGWRKRRRRVNIQTESESESYLLSRSDDIQQIAYHMMESLTETNVIILLAVFTEMTLGLAEVDGSLRRDNFSESILCSDVFQFLGNFSRQSIHFIGDRLLLRVIN